MLLLSLCSIVFSKFSQIQDCFGIVPDLPMLLQKSLSLPWVSRLPAPHSCLQQLTQSQAVPKPYD